MLASVLLQAFSVSACRPQLRLRGPFELDAVHRSQRRDGDLHSAHGLVHPRRTSLGRRRFSSAAPQLRRRPAPALQRQDNTLGHWLSITSGSPCSAAPRATLSAPTPSTPPLWAAASLRRSARCPFSPFSWDCIERVVTPVVTLCTSSAVVEKQSKRSRIKVLRFVGHRAHLRRYPLHPRFLIYLFITVKPSPVDCTHSHLTRGTPAGGPPAPGPGRALALARPHPL